MKEDENIVLIKVDGVVKTIIGLGENMDNTMVVNKVLRSLLDRYDPKFSSLKESKKLIKLQMEKIQEILTTYEMRKEQDKPTKFEVAFQASKGQKQIN